MVLSDFSGESLKKLIATQPLNVSKFLQVAVQLASTIAAMHQNNIVHKDLKPDNILVDVKTCQVKIMVTMCSLLLMELRRSQCMPSISQKLVWCWSI